MGRIIKSPEVLRRLDLGAEVQTYLKRFLEGKTQFPVETEGVHKRVYIHKVSPHIDGIGIGEDEEVGGGLFLKYHPVETEFYDYVISLGGELFYTLPPITILGRRKENDNRLKINSFISMRVMNSSLSILRNTEEYYFVNGILDEFCGKEEWTSKRILELEYPGEPEDRQLNITDRFHGSEIKKPKDLEKRVNNMALANQAIKMYLQERKGYFENQRERGKAFAQKLKAKL